MPFLWMSTCISDISYRFSEPGNYSKPLKVQWSVNGFEHSNGTLGVLGLCCIITDGFSGLLTARRC